MSRILFVLLACSAVAVAQAPAQAPAKIQTLIISGQNVPGHDWRMVTPQLKKALEDTGRFEVRVTDEFRGAGPETLAPYALVVLNYYDGRNKDLAWGERTQKALIDFVRQGKGVVLYHFSAAAFDGWTEYEQMSGGNWRPNNGHHSPPHNFMVDIKDFEHPITKGLRKRLPQPGDELYANLRWQPAGSYHVLATAWDDHKLYAGKARQPTPGDGMDHPMLWTLNFGQGRVFATALGHDAPAVKTPTFVGTFTRGAEWAATGAVTIPAPPEITEGGRRQYPEPPVVTPGTAPSDAVALFNGQDMTGWTREDGSPTGCTAAQGVVNCTTGAGDLYTQAKLGSAQIHLEFLTPEMPNHKGQLKGNSGIYLQGLTEIQLLDSYQNPTYVTGMLGAIYGEHPPLVNASRRPGEWQSFDLVYNAPKCNQRGVPDVDATLTVLLNGVLIQNQAPVRFKKGMCEPGRLMLQDHSGFKDAPTTTMKFRNLWYRPLN